MDIHSHKPRHESISDVHRTCTLLQPDRELELLESGRQTNMPKPMEKSELKTLAASTAGSQAPLIQSGRQTLNCNIMRNPQPAQQSITTLSSLGFTHQRFGGFRACSSHMLYRWHRRLLRSSAALQAKWLGFALRFLSRVSQLQPGAVDERKTDKHRALQRKLQCCLVVALHHTHFQQIYTVVVDLPPTK